MSLPPYLTEDEIAHITKPRTQGAARMRYLQGLGLKVVARPNGQPLVIRTEWERLREAADADLTLDEIRRMSQPFAGIAGVYFLLLAGTVVYVGQSSNVYSRLEDHRGKIDFDRWHFVRVEDKRERLRIEREYIQGFRPAVNLTRGEVR